MSGADQELVDYLLGELAASDRARVEDRLAAEPGLRRELEELRPVVSGLTALPEEAWNRLEAPPLELPTDAPVPVRPTLGERARELVMAGRVPALGLAAAAIAALLVGVGIGIFATGDEDAGPEPVAAVALEPVVADADADGEATILGEGTGGQVELDVSGLDPSRPGEAYELWLLNSAEDVVSLGTFRVPTSGDASVRVPLPVEPSEFTFFDISLETVGGDGSHSGQSVLRGATA